MPPAVQLDKHAMCLSIRNEVVVYSDALPSDQRVGRAIKSRAERYAEYML